jgi:hypothetical protein
MFNDPFMMFFLLIGICLAIENKPLLSAFFVTLALSTKAGVILFLPSFFGSI